MVTLSHWEPNANSGKPMLALAELGVEHESRYLDLLKCDQHQPEYLRINPDGIIPAMVHGERVLTESTPMMECIDEASPGPPLRPSDPRGRWRMRWWMRFFDAYFAPSLSMSGCAAFVGPAARRRDPAELRAAIERIALESRRIAWRKAI
jgi:GST-like protein